MESRVAGGKGIVLQPRRSRFVTVPAHSGPEPIAVTETPFPPAALPLMFANKSRPTATRMSLSTMTEPLQLRGIHRHLPAEHRNIPSGVMQAVLMHALQLRKSCREVFLLCDIQRHSLAEAAQILGISRAAAARRLRLARRRMDEVIERLCGATQQPS